MLTHALVKYTVSANVFPLVANDGGDFVMCTPADETFPEIFPAEVIHFRKPSVKEWKGYMDFLIKKFGTDDIKDFIKKYEGKKEWGEYVKSAIEKIESLEKKKS